MSCAAGMAVLDVLEKDDLQKKAQDVGAYMMQRLKTLQKMHPLIGDVRGNGLFIGVELVRNRDTLEPATMEAEYLIERMKDLGILLSTDGPFNNVLKIKPPLIFSREDSDIMIEMLERVLSEDYVTNQYE